MISVGFSRTDGPLSRIIRWFTKAPVSHCFVVFHWLDADWVLEADWSGIVLSSYERFREFNTVVKIVELPNTHLLDLKPALMQLGKKYDYGGMIGSAWVLFGRYLKLRLHNPLQSNKALFCSEFVVEYVLKPIGWTGSENLTSGDTNPNDLMEFLDK